MYKELIGERLSRQRPCCVRGRTKEGLVAAACFGRGLTAESQDGGLCNSPFMCVAWLFLSGEVQHWVW